MQALILAAGRGSRLGDKSAEVPKCLLEVGRRPLIEHQLETLAEAGIGPVGMVLGYCADEIKEVVGIRAEFILNARWSVTNSLYSFLLARDWVKGPLIILNSDILLHPDIIDRLLNAAGDAFAYDSTSGHGREHMKVKVVRKRLVTMSKEMPPEEVSGENVGALRFSAEGVEALFEKAEAIAAAGGENKWLGSAVCELAAEREIRGVDIAGLPWGEVDFSYDLDRARKEVWPAIERDLARRRSWWRQAARWASVLLLLVVFGLVFSRSFAPPVESAWDSVDLDNLDRVTITAGDARKRWSVLSGDDSIEVPVIGPRRVRIESRVLLDPKAVRAHPYVLGVSLDGELVDWFKENGAPSGTWKHPQWTVGKKRRLVIDVPEGRHLAQVRLVASPAGRCLVRIRQEDADEEAED